MNLAHLALSLLDAFKPALNCEVLTREDASQELKISLDGRTVWINANGDTTGMANCPSERDAQIAALTAERDALISRIADGLTTLAACRALVKRLDLNPHLVDRFVRRELQAAREALQL